MERLCEQTQARLIDGDALDRALERHRLECDPCREVGEEVAAAGPALEAWAREAGAGAPGALTREVRERTRARAVSAIERGAGEKSAAAASRPASVVEMVRPDATRRRWPGRKLFWAAAAVAMLGLTGMAATSLLNRRAIGRVEFASGSLELIGSQPGRRIEGLSSAPLRRETVVRSTANSEGVLRLGREGGVRLVLGRSTEIAIAGQDRIELRRGSIWLSVDPAGRGFRVRTPQGVAWVTGTIFGVTAGEAGTTVEVIEGSVQVERGADRVAVGAAEQVALDADGLKPVEPRSDGDQVSAWVTRLHGAMARAQAAAYVPSADRVRK